MKTVDSGGGTKVSIANQSASPGDSFITLSPNTDLTGERVLTAGNGITLTDNGPNTTVVIAADLQAVMLKIASLRG